MEERINFAKKNTFNLYYKGLLLGRFLGTASFWDLVPVARARTDTACYGPVHSYYKKFAFDICLIWQHLSGTSNFSFTSPLTMLVSKLQEPTQHFKLYLQLQK